VIFLAGTIPYPRLDDSKENKRKSEKLINKSLGKLHKNQELCFLIIPDY